MISEECWRRELLLGLQLRCAQRKDILYRVAAAQTLSCLYAEGNICRGETRYQHGSAKLGEMFQLNAFFQERKKDIQQR